MTTIGKYRNIGASVISGEEHEEILRKANADPARVAEQGDGGRAFGAPTTSIAMATENVVTRCGQRGEVACLEKEAAARPLLANRRFAGM
jgi:hypothetical protein